MSWHFCIITREKRAFKFCIGSMNKGSGWGDGVIGDCTGSGHGWPECFYEDYFKGTGTGDGYDPDYNYGITVDAFGDTDSYGDGDGDGDGYGESGDGTSSEVWS